MRRDLSDKPQKIKNIEHDAKFRISRHFLIFEDRFYILNIPGFFYLRDIAVFLGCEVKCMCWCGSRAAQSIKVETYTAKFLESSDVNTRAFSMLQSDVHARCVSYIYTCMVPVKLQRYTSTLLVR